MSSDAPAERADQYACTEAVLEETPDAAIVSNLGVASYVLSGVADRDRNFYQWGSMGVTTSIGVGVALGTDAPVTVLEGDGSLLMSMGMLATVAEQDPSNLTVVVWNNEQYATTGGQPSLSRRVAFADAAELFGLPGYRATTNEEFRDAYRDAVARDGAAVVECVVEPVDPDARPPFDYAHIKRRFRSAMEDGGEAADR